MEIPASVQSIALTIATVIVLTGCGAREPDNVVIQIAPFLRSATQVHEQVQTRRKTVWFEIDAPYDAVVAEASKSLSPGWSKKIHKRIVSFSKLQLPSGYSRVYLSIGKGDFRGLRTSEKSLVMFVLDKSQ